MKNQLQPKEYKRFTPKPIGADNTLEAVLNTTIESLKQGRPPVYPETEQGLEDFKQATIDYFQYVKDTNANPDIDKKLVPDIEGWAVFTSLTRRTILTYEKQRGENWRNFIEQVKNARAACKKELAFHQQIPQVVFMFDACNNHGYTNTSEFKVEAISDKHQRVLTAAELPRLGEPKEDMEKNAAQLPKLGDMGSNSEALPYLAHAEPDTAAE